MAAREGCGANPGPVHSRTWGDPTSSSWGQLGTGNHTPVFSYCDRHYTKNICWGETAAAVTTAHSLDASSPSTGNLLYILQFKRTDDQDCSTKRSTEALNDCSWEAEGRQAELWGVFNDGSFQNTYRESVWKICIAKKKKLPFFFRHYQPAQTESAKQEMHTNKNTEYLKWNERDAWEYH